MFKILFFVLLVSVTINAAEINKLTDAVVKDLYNNDFSFKKFEGKCVLIINTASGCGFTNSNMKYLNELTKRLPQLEIVAFPSNTFGQEPKNSEELKDWFFNTWSAKYNVMAKTDAHNSDIYKFLIQRAGGKQVIWNYGKYVVEKDGLTATRYGPPAGGPLSFVAEQKGLTISQYSLVFTIFEVVKFAFAPFCSKIAIKMTPKVLLITSLFVIAYCSLIFGFLTYSKDGDEFLILCLIVRISWALGAAAGVTACNLCGTLLFPNHISTIYSANEIGVGLGYQAAPFFGGYLFELGGFALPFAATSILCLISIIPIYFLIQNELKPSSQNKKQKSTSFLACLKVPGISINMIVILITCFAIGFNEPTLDPHLREINPQFSPSQVGHIFLISSVIYSISAFSFGQIAKWRHSYYLIFIGLIMLLCSFIFVGPIYGLPLKPDVFFNCHKGHYSSYHFDDCIKEARNYLPDNDTTMAAISGLYTSSYALGTAIGPFFAGIMIEKYGYRKATIPMALSIVLLSILVLIYVLKIKKF